MTELINEETSASLTEEESECKPNVLLKPLKNNNMTGLSYYIPKDNGSIVKHTKMMQEALILILQRIEIRKKVIPSLHKI